MNAVLALCRKWHLLTAAHFYAVSPPSVDQHNHLGQLCSAMDTSKNQGQIWTSIFFIGSPTHRKLLLKNKKSFALVNGSPEAKLHVDSWGQNLAKIWTHVLLAIQRGGKEDILNKREEHFCYGSSESPPAKHGSGELMWQRVTSRGL